MIDKVQSEIDDILHVCTEWNWWYTTCMYRVKLMIYYMYVQSEIDDILYVCTEWPWW